MPLTEYENGFPGGVAIRGVPLVTPMPGRVFWVCNRSSPEAGGAAGNSGESPESPISTVPIALGYCTAGRGDTIMVMPGHAETVTSTSHALNKAGVTVVCLGSGSARPTFTYGAAAATITVSAANFSWYGGRFVGNFDNVASAFTIGAATDFHLEGGEFIDVANNLHFLSIVTTGATANAADGLSVQKCKWHALALAPAAFVSVLGTLHRLQFKGNKATMAVTDDEGHFVTFADKVVTQAEIEGNYLQCTGSTGAAVGIFLTGSATTCTGYVSDNRVSSLDTTAELIATAGTGLSYYNNLYTGTADTSGKVWPLADGT